MDAKQASLLADRPWLDPAATPQIVIDGVGKHYDGVPVLDGVSLQIHKGEMFTLVGASGCGKTTLLRMLAGFTDPTTGRILIDGADMQGVPPHERPVNMMFQSYALFPHMSVRDNVGYGLRSLRLDRASAGLRIDEALEMVKLGPLAARRPHQLSGGQRQRVALARALIRRPRVLLLDEPLSALDRKLRAETQFELMNIQYELGITFVIVTHDQDEAMALSTRIAVMDRGRVVQTGTPAEIYEYPRTRFVADFVGTMNFFEGSVSAVTGHAVSVRCEEAGCELVVTTSTPPAPGEAVTVAVRPEKIRIRRQPPAGDGANRMRGVVWELGYLGDRSTYRIRTTGGRQVTVVAPNERRSPELAIDWNEEVFLGWDADAACILQS